MLPEHTAIELVVTPVLVSAIPNANIEFEENVGVAIGWTITFPGTKAKRGFITMGYGGHYIKYEVPAAHQGDWVQKVHEAIRSLIHSDKAVAKHLSKLEVEVSVFSGPFETKVLRSPILLGPLF